MTETRAKVFIHAVQAMVGASRDDPSAMFTEDVGCWSPVLKASSLAELTEAMREREDTLSNINVQVRGLHSGGNRVMAEWRLEADHTGELVLDNELKVPPSGRHIHLGGASFADFRGDKIRAVRSYFDEMALIEQLMGAGD